MERDGFGPALRGRVFAALTGRTGDVTGDRTAPVRDRLLAAYGTTARGGLNTRAAAADLGVSQRTVQRWVAPEGRRERTTPSRANDTAITRKARQAATTRRGRRDSLAPARTGPMMRRGTQLRVTGEQGVTDAGRQYRRQRTIPLTLDPDDVAAMLDAYEAGGDAGFVSWLEGHADATYVGGWEFGTITDLDFS